MIDVAGRPVTEIPSDAIKKLMHDKALSEFETIEKFCLHHGLEQRHITRFFMTDSLTPKTKEVMQLTNTHLLIVSDLDQETKSVFENLDNSDKLKVIQDGIKGFLSS